MLSIIFVNNKKKIICYWRAGWPGSNYDDPVFENCDMGRNPRIFFNHNQCINWQLLTLEMWYRGSPHFVISQFRDPRYFMIHFQWKIAKKLDFRKFFKVQFLLVRFFIQDRTIFPISTFFFSNCYSHKPFTKLTF